MLIGACGACDSGGGAAQCVLWARCERDDRRWRRGVPASRSLSGSNNGRGEPPSGAELHSLALPTEPTVRLGTGCGGGTCAFASARRGGNSEGFILIFSQLPLVRLGVGGLWVASRTPHTAFAKEILGTKRPWLGLGLGLSCLGIGHDTPEHSKRLGYPCRGTPKCAAAGEG